MNPEKRRAQVLEHATELFGRQGYHKTSVTDIIKAAGVARGTFYLYFDSKRAIFEEALDALLDRLSSRILRVETTENAPPARAQIIDNIVRIIDLFIEERALLAILLRGTEGTDGEFDAKLADFYTKTAELIEQSLNFGKELGLVRNCDSQVASLAALGMLKEVLHHILRQGDEPSDISAMASSLYDIFASGVMNP